MLSAYDRDDRRVARDVEVLDRVIDDGRVVGQQGRDVARVGNEPLDLGGRVGPVDYFRVLLDELYLVSGAHEIVRDEEPDVAGTGDCDPHQTSPPASMCACSSSVASTCDTNTSTSPSRPTLSDLTICALPNPGTALSANL